MNEVTKENYQKCLLYYTLHGEKMVYPEKRHEWRKAVKKRFSLGTNPELREIIAIMDALHMGDFEKAKDIYQSKMFHSIGIMAKDDRDTVLGVVAYFSKRGPEFYRMIRGEVLPIKIDKRIFKIEEENKKYAQKYDLEAEKD